MKEEKEKRSLPDSQVMNAANHGAEPGVSDAYFAMLAPTTVSHCLVMTSL